MSSLLDEPFNASGSAPSGEQHIQPFPGLPVLICLINDLVKYIHFLEQNLNTYAISFWLSCQEKRIFGSRLLIMPTLRKVALGLFNFVHVLR